MSLNCFQRLSFLFLLLVIAVPALSRDWQGTGNMTQENMTEIQNTINTYPITTATTSTDFDNIAKNISTHLNQIWAPAWNVVLLTHGPTYDTVVYGYAFNNHWMWINGMTREGTFNKLAYIIWKDFNCHGWKKRFEFGTSTFTADQKTAIDSYSFTKVTTDVWAEAFDFVNFVSAKSSLSSGAYSVIMSQDAMTVMYAHICLVNSNFAYKPYLQNFNDGSYLLFQTR